MSTAAPVVASGTPVLPDLAWSGLIGRYREIVSPCTEAPDVFHLASFIAAVGCLIGRRAWVHSPHAIYPNFYCLLIGRTANARKTTAYQFALNLCDDVGNLEEPLRIKRLNGLASVEGLAEAMQNVSATGGGQPYRILCVEDEFRSLVTKAGQHSVANLIPRLTDLFNSPRTFEINTRTSPVVINGPFLALLAASTRAWFEESMTKRDVSGGFFNRWLVFEGEATRLLATPPPVDQNAWADVVVDIAEAVSHNRGEFTFATDANEYFSQFYIAARRDYDSEATARTDLHARKLGLLFAILADRRDGLVHLVDIESGVEIAKYCAQVAGPLVQSIDLTQKQRLERRVIEKIREDTGPTERDLYRALHCTASELNAVLHPLVGIGVIFAQNGRYHMA
jgi:hypothetical protein